jgi:hypothetical protein
MSNIEIEYDKIVDIERLVDSDESGEESMEIYDEHLTSVACHIQALDDSYTEDLDGNFGKDFTMYCDLLDILEGDKVIDMGTGQEYKVVGVRRFEQGDVDDHMELRIREFNN